MQLWSRVRCGTRLLCFRAAPVGGGRPMTGRLSERSDSAAAASHSLAGPTSAGTRRRRTKGVDACSTTTTHARRREGTAKGSATGERPMRHSRAACAAADVGEHGAATRRQRKRRKEERRREGLACRALVRERKGDCRLGKRSWSEQPCQNLQPSRSFSDRAAQRGSALLAVWLTARIVCEGELHAHSLLLSSSSSSSC